MNANPLTQEDLQAFMVLIDDVRCDMVEAQKQLVALQGLKEHIEQAASLTKTIQTTSETLLRRLDEPVIPGLQGSIDEIVQVLRQPPRPLRRRVVPLLGLVAGVAVLSAWLGWQSSRPARGVSERALLMERVHPILIDHYDTFPKSLKTLLSSAYRTQGMALAPAATNGGKR